MKLTKAIISLISILSTLVAIASYQILVPLINDGGECVTKGGQWGISTYEVCDSMIGFDIPLWWQVGRESLLPVSPFFGVAVGCVVALFLLLKSQK